MIREKIDKIVNKYYNETDECYNSFRYDDKAVSYTHLTLPTTSRV